MQEVAAELLMDDWNWWGRLRLQHPDFHQTIGLTAVAPPELPPPPPTIAGVKAEAQRRIIALTEKSSLQDCMINQLNGLMRGVELTKILAVGGAHTQAETQEVAALETMAAKVNAIRAASDVLEAMSPIPADYADDRYWSA